MDNSNTFRYAIARPIGPSKRESLPRMNDQDKWTRDRIMGPKSNKKKTKATHSSPPHTPPHSTPNKSQNSSKLEEELKRQKGTSPSTLYPDLSNVSDSFLRESTPATPSRESSSIRSFTQTDSLNNSFLSNQSSEKINQTPLHESEFDSKQRSYTPEGKNPPYSENKGPSQAQNNGLVWVFGILSVMVACYLAYAQLSTFHQTEKIFNNTELRSNIKDLKKLFPTQDQEVWGQFGSGIADVGSGKHRPAIFVLVASHNETTNCLARRVAELASYTLRGTGDVVLSPDKLENDTGKVLNFMEGRMNQTKAMVTDILSIQPEALKAFHDVCDEYSPLVKEAVYVFTMSSGGTEKTKDSRLFAEEQLRKRFSKAIVEDTLRALIVRITSGAVLAIKEEKSIPCLE